MYLKRKVDKYLTEWKNSSSKKPLIISGCRQIGKTRSILHFAKKNYENVIYINFVENPKYKLIIDNGLSVEDVLKSATRINPSLRFVPHQTIIVFDEFQELPELATSLKFFCIDGRFDVICSGSLLGINYKRIESNSVGYKSDYEMSSMDFEEFLWANGYGDEYILEILGKMVRVQPLDQLDFKILNELFLNYSLLGGMPEVIEKFVESKMFGEPLSIQSQLLKDYEEDIRKYAVGLDQARIINVFRSIANQLAKENKKFQISKVAKNAKFKDYNSCVEWLNDAGIINICRCLNFPSLPLKGNEIYNKFKIYFRDTGLLVASLDDEAREDFRINRNLGVYKGALYENIVADALVKSGYPLYYYKKEDSTLEEDFFVRTRKSLVPLEVKATNGTSKSLSTLIDNSRYSDIKFGIKLTGSNIGFNGKFYTFPYFCTFLLRKFLSNIDI